MNKIKHLGLGILIAILVSACANTPVQKTKRVDSYLQKNSSGSVNSAALIDRVDQSSLANSLTASKNNNLTYLASLTNSSNQQKGPVVLTDQFSDKKLVQFTANELPLNDYLHYVMGDILAVNYVLGEQVSADEKSVTLNLQQDISERKLFTLSEQLLNERGYIIRLEEEIYYIHKASSGISGNIVYGYGAKTSDVPATSVDIVQMVPFVYGLKNNLSLTLPRIAKVTATSDNEHQTFILKGKRREIIKALEFIQLMDQPGFNNRYIGAYRSTYVSNDELIKKLAELLKQEGISASDTQNDKAVAFVSLERIGSIIVFANSQKLIERVNYWALQIDQPATGNELQYFIYTPEFSRAQDIGESLQALFGGTNDQGVGNTTSAQNQNKGSQQSSTAKKVGATTISANNMTISVDERANALVFETTGQQYRKLLPLMKRLDILPKQVALEVIIAEVTLTDEFRQGVEFAFSKGEYSLSTLGALGISDFGGLSYGLSGPSGELALQLFQNNTHVNILSRPSLVVRDGVQASFNVGTEIPVVSETKNSDTNETSTTSIVYRKTGVSLNVTPTINGHGVVIMEVKQSISNTVDSDTQTTTPSIFSRDISSEVVAEDGQTVLLGGLISETSTNGDTKVPFFSSIPLIGELFKAKKERTEKTELVVMITPRVIESSNEWQKIKAEFSAALSQFKLN